MKCRQCGYKDDSGARRCPNCGADLKQGIWQKIALLFRDNNGKAPAKVAPPESEIETDLFTFKVTDVFFIEGRGVVVTGDIEQGTIHAGDQVHFTDTRGLEQCVTVTEIEMFRKVLEKAEAGEMVGLYLTDIQKEDIAAGTIITR